MLPVLAMNLEPTKPCVVDDFIHRMKEIQCSVKESFLNVGCTRSGVNNHHGLKRAYPLRSRLPEHNGESCYFVGKFHPVVIQHFTKGLRIFNQLSPRVTDYQ